MGELKKGDQVHGFIILDIQELPEMQSIGVFAKHRITGLEVFHIVNDDDENLFAYAFATPPHDSTGVAHILEHSVLCGSKNYPLKDPFNILAKQSVKTFLNAMTFPDKTVYPASSMVEADYFNLMKVYGDAVFFPLLKEEVFKQEGHRFEVAPDGNISIQGVVYNEMKGNYSSFDSIAGDWSIRSLLPDTCYDFDSGGDPTEIPNLSYAEFLEFHKKWYHPSNCKVFLCGNIATSRQLELLEQMFLSQFTTNTGAAKIESVKPFVNPVELSIPAPLSEQEDASKVTVMLNWLLPDAVCSDALMEANLIAEILLGHDGAPLSKALLDSKLGEDISPQTGLETELKHMCFTAGLRGVSKDKKNKLEPLVFDTIKDIIEQGISENDIQTALRAIDFSNREIRRSGGPFSLILMRRALRGWIHGEGPFASFRYIPAFETLKKKIQDTPYFVETLLKEWFLNNKHRALVVVYPDVDYEKTIELAYKEKINHFESTLTEETKKKILEEQEAYSQFQQQSDSLELQELIPHLKKTDFPELPEETRYSVDFVHTVPVIITEQATNGIAYANFAIPVDTIPADLYPLLPLFVQLLTSCGTKKYSWAESSKRTATYTGGLGASLFTSSAVEDVVVTEPLPQAVLGRDYVFLRVKMLSELIPEALALTLDFLTEVDFSDTERIRDLMLEFRNDLDSSIAPAGNQYVVSYASYAYSRSKTVEEIWNGLTQIRFIRKLSKKIKNQQKRKVMIEQLYRIKDILLDSGMIIHLTGSRDLIDAMLDSLKPLVSNFKPPFKIDPTSKDELITLIDTKKSFPVKQNEKPNKSVISVVNFIKAPVQVGFAATVMPSPSIVSKEHALSTVLNRWLSNGPLWEKVRVIGGAYGVFAFTDPLESIQVFASYRDPQPLTTLGLFYDSLVQASENVINELELEKTIAGCYSRELQPRSPSDKGFSAFVRILYGLTDDLRRNKIMYILNSTPIEIQSLAKDLLLDFNSSNKVVLAHKKELQKNPKENSRKIIKLRI